MPRESGFASLRVVALLLCCVGVLAAQSPRRLVYVLAGQSNIEKLEISDPSAPSLSPRSNVVYRLQYTFAAQAAAPTTPMMVLGDRLGAAHPADNVEVVMLAESGSALLLQNIFPPFGFWMDPSSWGNGAAFMNTVVPLLGSVLQNGTPIDEFHLVWGQGETDILQPVVPGITQAQYEYYAQLLFGWIAFVAGGTQTYEVHLVTPGAIEAGWQQPAPADALRDAYFDMERNPMPTPPGWSARIASVAHHYDLKHAVSGGQLDPHHLSPTCYVMLAGRIADGIIAPAGMPKISGVLTVSGTDATVSTSAQLTPVALGTSFNNYFAVSDNSGQPVVFQVLVQANSVTVRASTSFVPPVHVRYVAGSGFNGNWTSGPIVSTTGSPLEPFSF